MRKNSEHLQWIHDRMVYQYGESPNVDFLIKLRNIIAETKQTEEQFEGYLKFIQEKNKK